MKEGGRVNMQHSIMHAVLRVHFHEHNTIQVALCTDTKCSSYVDFTDRNYTLPECRVLSLPPLSLLSLCCCCCCRALLSSSFPLSYSAPGHQLAQWVSLPGGCAGLAAGLRQGRAPACCAGWGVALGVHGCRASRGVRHLPHPDHPRRARSLKCRQCQYPDDRCARARALAVSPLRSCPWSCCSGLPLWS